MRPRSLAMLALAILLAIASVYLVRSWMQSQLRPLAVAPPPVPRTTPIVVAAAPLRFGDAVTRERLGLLDWPVGRLPEGAFRSLAEVLGEGGEARIALRATAVNEPLLASRVSGLGARASLSTLIAPGLRAAAIRVNDVLGVAGFVRPGDRVDVLLTGGQGAGRVARLAGESTSEILLQNLKVLGVDQDADVERDKPAVVRTVTLEVTPRQAQQLALAQSLGTLSLILRAVASTEMTAAPAVGPSDLGLGAGLGAPAQRPAAHQAPAAAPSRLAQAPPPQGPRDGRISVRIVRGLQASQHEVAAEPSPGARPASGRPSSAPHGHPAQARPIVAPPGATPGRLDASRRGAGDG